METTGKACMPVFVIILALVHILYDYIQLSKTGKYPTSLVALGSLKSD